MRRISLIHSVGDALIFAAAELVADRSDKGDEVAFSSESRGAAAGNIADDADHPDDDGGIDTGPAGVVVEADVAAHDGNLECAAGFADALAGVVQVPPGRGLLRIGGVEAIGDRDRFRTGGNDVARSLADSDHRALPGVERGISRGA